jgi:hypothetical protein
MANVMISLPDKLLNELDRNAKARHKKRSEIFRDLVVLYLNRPNITEPAAFREELAGNAFEGLREFTFELKPTETAEGLIRELRESR